jgi:transposase, IS5 family
MMSARQVTIAEMRLEKFRKTTRRARFLGKMEQIVPWRELRALIRPVYPRPVGAGASPAVLERMLRIYFLQHWFHLSDLAVEEALYDTETMRAFVGIDLER